MSIKNKLALVSASAMLLPVMALAYTGPEEPGEGTVASVESVVQNVVGKVWIVFAALAVVMFVYAGVKFLLANGSPEKIAEARTAALWGVIGVVVMILAYSIFNIAGSLIMGGA